MNYRAQPEHGRAEPKKSFNRTLKEKKSDEMWKIIRGEKLPETVKTVSQGTC